VRAMPLLVVLVSATVAIAAESPAPLWQIGKPDGKNAEFAFAPGDYSRCKDDPFFVVGQSDPKRDWPYAHPGPTDSWAGSRPHTFTVLFGLKSLPKEGACTLRIDLLDTHSQSPPELRVAVNGKPTGAKQMPPGGGDDSIFGHPEKGKPHRWEVTFPADLLKAGDNEIAISTQAGSWVLYDCVALAAPAGAELAPLAMKSTTFRSMKSAPLLVEKGGKMCQVVQVTLRHIGGESEALVRVAGGEPVKVALRHGEHTIEAPVAAVEKETTVTVVVEADGKTLAKEEVRLKPVRKWVVYILPHSHVDIGYTHVQTDVEKAHWKFYEQAIEASRKTADYPDGAQFKWNVEVLWAVDSNLKQAAPEKQKEFIDAVKAGWIGLDALYGNELTGLCRPEELLQLARYATILSERCGTPIDSAMISDVPGYTWGTVAALSQAGVRYLSSGPNGGDRIGFTLAAWQDKPFWWVAPSGDRKVLVWIPYKGYWRAFNSGQDVLAHLAKIEENGYPYDLVQLRYCLGDNAGPGTSLSEVVKDWNSTHAYPKLVIATTGAMFRDFEQRYGASLPSAAGDFTPYWEDGAASSARETALNRDSAERLVQAGALWAMLAPSKFPAAGFYDAWRNVVLYDEHTWGAHCSISKPDDPFTLSQWKIKQAFALDGDKQSQKLLADALAVRGKPAGGAQVDVFNTTSWTRTDVALLPKAISLAGDVVKDAAGATVPSQRLSTGQIAVLVRDLPPFAGRRLTVASAQSPPERSSLRAEGPMLTTPLLALRIDEKTGAIVSLKSKALGVELVDAKAATALNDYFYLPGSDLKGLVRSGPAKISVKEQGPLVASLVVESDAPGCNKLTREIRVYDGLDRVDIINTVDKKAIRTKEGVHFGFGFNVPGGVVRMDIPWAVVRPETDQIPGACKNWFTVQRWVDVSNSQYGVTLATVDAPMMEVGGITANLIGSQNNIAAWIEHLAPSQTLYSWVMNNHWHTNYKADQEGPTVFRYSLLVHGAYDGEQAARFGIEASQPMRRRLRRRASPFPRRASSWPR
jgi:alpha-mannosidase